MADKHFAILDDDNEVINVVIGDESEFANEQAMATFQGVDVGKVKEYSEDGTYLNRGVAGIGKTYESGDDYFKPEQPHASWTYNSTNREWVAPVTEPTAYSETYNYWWDEENNRWKGYKCSGSPNYEPTEDPRVDYIWNPTTTTWETP